MMSKGFVAFFTNGAQHSIFHNCSTQKTGLPGAAI